MTTLATVPTLTPTPTPTITLYRYAFTSVCVDSLDNIYAAETPNLLYASDEMILKVTPSGVAATFAVSGVFPIAGRAINNCSVTADGQGNIYTVGIDGSVFQITADGTQITVAAVARWFFSSIGSFPHPPQGLVVDAAGNLFATATNLNPSGYAGPVEFKRLTATPFIVVQPLGADVVVGSATQISVYAISSNELSYQWSRDGNAITGATSTTYNATLSGNYTVVVSTSAGSIASTVATVTVKTAEGIPVVAAPTITRQPESASIVFGSSSVLSVTAVSTDPLTYQWYLDGVAVEGAAAASYEVRMPGNYSVKVSSGAGSVTSNAASIATTTAAGIPVVAAPTIIAPPKNTGFGYGGTANLSVQTVATVPISYQWRMNGSNIPGATAASFTATAPGAYSVTATTQAGSVTTDPVDVTLVNRPANLSSRAAVGTGDGISIAGFVVASYSGEAKKVLIRGAGPGLSQLGVTGALPRPVLSLYDAQGRLIASNRGWADNATIAAAAVATGAFAFPAGSADAALLLDLAPGAYTAQVAGADGTTGVSLVEVYELAADSGHFVNISTRAAVGTGANVLIGGLVVSGSQPSLMLIRAVGPGLSALGVSGALTQPVLSLYNAKGELIAVNVGWSNGGSAEAVAIAAAAVKTGAFSLVPGSTDSALLLNLAPGSYTAQVSGVNNTTGVALVEIYQVPQ